LCVSYDRKTGKLQNFFRRPLSWYVTLYEKYYRDKSWICYKICCRAALKDSEAISAVVAPTVQICAFRHAMPLLDRGKLKYMMLVCFFITGCIPNSIKFGILLRTFTLGAT
jgi:hypothetical protein